jgi:hypothetical protein
MRLYRGLKNLYRPERVDPGRFSGTDFTDCPAIALLYAQSPRGVILVADLDDDAATAPNRICAASWPEREARRFILWGRFDDFITAVLPAKDLRTRLRREGCRNAPVATKSRLLRAAIDEELRVRALRSQLDSRSDIADRSTSYEQGRVISHER